MPPAEATIPTTDEGLIRGDGVFEVIRVYDGQLVRPRGASRAPGALGAQPPPRVRPRGGAQRRLPPARAGRDPAPPTSQLRIVLTRGGRRLLLDRAAAREPRRARAWPRSPTRPRASSTASSRSPTPATCSPRRLAQEHGFDEALLVTPHGRVLEAPTSSFFWVKDGAAAHAAAGRPHPGLDHPPHRHRGDRRGQERPCTLDDAARGRRSVPGLDHARGPAGRRPSTSTSYPASTPVSDRVAAGGRRAASGRELAAGAR